MARRVRSTPPPAPYVTATARRNAYVRWRRRFKGVMTQITDIAHNRRLYLQIRDVIDANPAIQVPSAFYDWMRIAYIVDQTLAIRRLVDFDKRTVSFVNLMQEIADHPEVITRTRFVHPYAQWMRDAGHRDFERFARPGAARITPAIIQKHRRDLIVAQRPIRRFVNRHVAHRSQHPMRRLPTYAQLDTCIDLLERLAKTYTLLLEQAALAQVVPVIQYDWLAPFRVPWLR